MSGLAILSTSFEVLICKWSDFSGKVGKLQFPSNETSSAKPLHGTLDFLLGFYKKKRGIVYNAVQSGSNFCRVFSVFL